MPSGRDIALMVLGTVLYDVLGSAMGQPEHGVIVIAQLAFLFLYRETEQKA